MRISSHRVELARDIFSRYASRLYVQDVQGETKPLHTNQNKSDGGIPDANSYIKPPEGITTDEYTKKVSELFSSSVQQTKDLIYKALTV